MRRAIAMGGAATNLAAVKHHLAEYDADVVQGTVLDRSEIDRQIGVHSTPARFGVRTALYISTATHVVTFALFVWFGQLVGLGWLWWIGLLITAAAFVYQHVVVTPTDLSRVNRAFFTANGFVGIALFLFALLDLALR